MEKPQPSVQEASGVSGQNASASVSAPLRVSQRTQNAKKVTRGETNDISYKAKSKVSVLDPEISN